MLVCELIVQFCLQCEPFFKSDAVAWAVASFNFGPALIGCETRADYRGRPSGTNQSGWNKSKGLKATSCGVASVCRLRDHHPAACRQHKGRTFCFCVQQPDLAGTSLAQICTSTVQLMPFLSSSTRRASCIFRQPNQIRVARQPKRRAAAGRTALTLHSANQWRRFQNYH